MVLQKEQPSWVQNFADIYTFLYKDFMSIIFLFDRCDFISDEHFQRNLKEETRKDHGSGTGL